MSLFSLFLWIVTIFGLINFIHIGLFIAGANIYDIRQIRRKHRISKRDPSDIYEPLVTVLVPAHNEEAGIVRTIDTINQSTYRNIAIVVIDDASSDKTSHLVRRYLREHASKTTSRLVERGGQMVREFTRTGNLPPICLLTRPVNGGKAAGLNYALKYAVQEGIVMTLDADSMLDKHAIANAVEYYRDEKVVGVAANVKIMQQRTVLGMLQKFEHMIGYRSKKFYTLTNSEFIIGGVASTYRYETLKRVGFYDTDTATEDIGLSMKIAAEGNRENRLVYAADVVASTEGVQTYGSLLRQRYRWKMGSLQNLLKYRGLFGNTSSRYSRMLTFYRIPMAFLSELMLLLQPLLIGYLLGLSLMHQTIGIWIGGYITVTIYVLWTIWPDEHHTPREKITLSLYAPMMYLCFFIMDSVQLNAIVRCAFNARKLTERSENHTWVSPERVGAAA